MPTTTIALPESYLPWIEKRRTELGIKSKHAFILAAIAALAGVPEIIKPLAVDETLAWPVVDVHCICLECKRGEHCGGGECIAPYPVMAKREITRMMCVCPECSVVAVK